MKVILDLNPDECLALIQVLERDIVFRDLSERVIDDIERYRHEWANEVRNLGYLRADMQVSDAWKKANELLFELPMPVRNRVAHKWHEHMHKMADKAEVRQAVADYMWSEGCDCCCDDEAHKIHKERLARLLDVEMYDDQSGYNFYQYSSKEQDDA